MMPRFDWNGSASLDVSTKVQQKREMWRIIFFTTGQIKSNWRAVEACPRMDSGGEAAT